MRGAAAVHHTADSQPARMSKSWRRFEHPCRKISAKRLRLEAPSLLAKAGQRRNAGRDILVKRQCSKGWLLLSLLWRSRDKSRATRSRQCCHRCRNQSATNHPGEQIGLCIDMEKFWSLRLKNSLRTTFGLYRFRAYDLKRLMRGSPD